MKYKSTVWCVVECECVLHYKREILTIRSFIGKKTSSEMIPYISHILNYPKTGHSFLEKS